MLRTNAVQAYRLDHDLAHDDHRRRRGGFGPRVLAKAREKGIGILALKTLAPRAYQGDEPRVRPEAWYHPIQTPEQAAIALRFTLSLPITAAVSPGDIDFFHGLLIFFSSEGPLFGGLSGLGRLGERSVGRCASN